MSAHLEASLSQVAGQRESFDYDAFDHRISKTVEVGGSTKTTYFMYDRDNVVLELTDNRTPQTGLEGKFSVYYAAALAIVAGRAGEAQSRRPAGSARTWTLTPWR